MCVIFKLEINLVIDGGIMNYDDLVIRKMHELPDSMKMEVLNFIEHLKSQQQENDNDDWADFSLSSALIGMEEEPVLYSLRDLKELFS